MQAFAEKIDNLITLGRNCATRRDYEAWTGRVWSFLVVAVDSEAAAAFQSLHQSPDESPGWIEGLERQIGHLEGLALRVEAKGIEATKREHMHEPTSPSGAALTKVFVVHGHDDAAKESVARFLGKLGLEPIILSEQANGGRTVIEKFEAFADVGFAVALFTPDDVGAVVSEKANLNPRARQNVVLELGYFTGKLGRCKVCALYKPGIELPSDLHGVIFLELDPKGAWKTKLAQELVQAGMKIKLEGLLSG
jgi:predicted nucleotide-binding protein